MSSVRVITWNIARGDQSGRWLGLLSRVVGDAPGAAVVCLQEVRPTAWEALCETGWLHPVFWSLDFRPPGRFDGRNRKLGCAIGVSGGAQMTAAGVVDRAPYPDRTLWARCQIGGVPFGALNVHALTGVGHKRTKSSQFRSLAEHLVDRGAAVPQLLCGDMNEPKVDAHDPAEVAFWRPGGGSVTDHAKSGAGLLLGTAAEHGLKDCFRTWLADRPEEAARIRAAQPDGPLAVTYERGRGRKTPCRYDVIYASTEWRVENIEHLYREGCEAGSDHALVLADLEFRA